MRSNLMSKMSLVAVGVVVGLVTQAYGAVSAPYSVDFTTGTVPADFTKMGGLNDANGNSDVWTTTGSAWEHSFASVDGGSNGSSQIIETTGVSGNNFTVTTNFTIAARNLTGSAGNTTMPILANHPTQSYWTSDTFYTVSVRMAENWSGASDLFSIASSDVSTVDWNPIVLASQSLSSRLAVDGQYTMSVTGTYAGTTLTLDAVLKEGTTVLASIQAVEATPKAGDYFGLSDGSGWGSSASTRYSNFAISVPEPTSLGLLGVAAAGLMARRRAAR